MPSQTRVAVLGAGIQGSFAALALAAKGIDVTLFDQAKTGLTAASLWNEGKLHLGHIYAGDQTRKTARLMIEGSLQFIPFLHRHAPGIDEHTHISRPFTYLIMKDTLFPSETLEAHYKWCSEVAANLINSNYGYYPGDATTLRKLPEAERTSTFASETSTDAFETGEISIDTHAVADAVKKAIEASPKIDCQFDVSINAVRREADDRLSVSGSGNTSLGTYDHVVNALWQDRLAIDATMGIVPNRPFLFRYKAAVHADSMPDIQNVPSTTMVLGPYGDIVRFASGRVYLSWYPSGCVSRVTDANVPSSWTTGSVMKDRGALAVDIVEQLAAHVPGAIAFRGQIDASHVAGGTIFTWGDTEIDRVDSELHSRFDVGVNTYHRNYHSIDTGKYCLAALFADTVAERVR